MKKFLITTALVAVAAPAFAMDVDINGYARFGIAAVDIEGKADSTSQKDWEFEFKGSEEFDNGITAFVDLEVDAQGGSENLRSDDVTFGLKGGFGAITVGAFNNGKVKAGLGHMVFVGSANPFGGVEATDNQCEIVGTAGNGKGCLNALAIADYRDDAPTIAYSTPNISGFSAGVQYQVNTRDGQWTVADEGNNGRSGPSIGASYAGDFGGASVKVGGAYTSLTTEATGAEDIDETMYAMGIQASIDGFKGTVTFKAGEIEQTGAADIEYDFYQVGAQYATGPFNFTAAYANGEEGGSDYSYTALAASYKIGGSASVFVGYDQGELGSTDGSIYGAGLQVKF